jgi:hypothetical protein
MKKLTLCFALAMSLVTINAEPIFFSDTGSWYELVEAYNTNTWTEAKTAAAARSYRGIPGRLATINSQAENNFIANSILPSFPNPGTRCWWIGGFQRANSSEPDGGWGWITGEPWTFINWRRFEPNNAGTNSDFLAMYNLEEGGTWNDMGDDSVIWSYGYVVEYPTPRLSIRVSQVELCWSSETNQVYQLQYRSTLTTNTWTDLGSPIPGNSPTTCTYDAVAPGSPQRFYMSAYK